MQIPILGHQETHVYDYIHQRKDNLFNQPGELNTPPALVKPNNIRAEYQVPPPPRPIEKINDQPIQVNKYVKMVFF